MDIKDFLKKDKFAQLLGIELLEIGNGKAKSRMEIKEEHLNAVETVQGGVVFSLADYTLASAANTHGNIAVTVNSSINFVKTATKEFLFAEAVETSKNTKLATYQVRVTNSQNELIAELHGMVYRMKKTF
ncbi:MAG: PaaI family thioesterase [Bacteroidales bacterium]|jgi:acyl-CoA thioesterase|nr:PaaI family thioesterase [Bacteroidales bacterium]MDD4213365.1 PaaI family thioesterase [Bacteroidales bacterium]